MTTEYVIYSTPTCTYCTKAKKLFKDYGIGFEERDARDANNFHFLESQGCKTVPQIWRSFSGDTYEHIGGYSDLKDYLLVNYS